MTMSAKSGQLQKPHPLFQTLKRQHLQQRDVALAGVKEEVMKMAGKKG